MDQRLKELRGTGRRDFLRWSATVAAVLGLERSRFLNVLGDSAGVAMADQAACPTTNRSVHLVAGNGGFAWFQLLFPHVAVALKGDGNAVPIIAVVVQRCKFHVGVRHGEGFQHVAVARVDEGLRLVVGVKAVIFLA